MGKKFTVRHAFKDSGNQFEEGNTHDIDNVAIPENQKVARLKLWYDAGWVEIEGDDPPPDIDPHRRVTLEMKSTVQAQSQEVKS